MVEYGMQVYLELAVKNINEVEKQVKDSFKNVSKSISSSFQEIFNSIGSELSNIVGSIQRMIEKINKSIGSVINSKNKKEKETSTGGMGGLISAGGGAIAGILAAVAGTFMVVKSINNSIDKMTSELESSSSAFKGTKDLMDKMWNIALRPLGNIMSTLMRPYLVLAMKTMQPKLQQMMGIISKSGGNVSEKDMAEITAIWEDTASALGGIFQNAMGLLKPFISEIDGFMKGLDLIYNNFISGVDSWAKGFVSALMTGSETLNSTIMQNILLGSSEFTNLPKNIKDQFFMWVNSNPAEFQKLPSDVKNQMYNWITSNPTVLTVLSSDISKEYYNQLSNPAGLSDLQKLPTQVGNLFFNTIQSNIKSMSDAFVGKSGGSKIAPLSDYLYGAGNNVYTSTLSTTSKKKQSGGYVGQDGLYMLHSGEEVISKQRTNTNQNTIVNNNFNFSGSVRSEIDINSMARRIATVNEMELKRRGIV